MLTGMIDQTEVASFFDERAPAWDERRKACSETLDAILDQADIREGVRVVDVGCGTGVLFSRYLARGARHVTGVDLSAKMLAVAREKFTDARIELVNADIERVEIGGSFDRAVVLNALPHFPCPERLAGRLAALLEPGGRLTVAHDLGRDRLNALHGHRAGSVSRELPSASELASILSLYFEVDAAYSDERMYVVSGVRNAPLKAPPWHPV